MAVPAVAQDHRPPITALAFTPQGDAFLAASQAGLVKYQWPSLEPLQSYQSALTNIHDICFSPDGARFAVGGGSPAESGAVEIYSTASPDHSEPILTCESHDDSVMGVAWKSDDSVASCSLDHEIIIWNANDGSELRRLRGHSRGVVALCFLEKGMTLVSAGLDHNIRVWNVDSGTLTRTLNNHTLPLHRIAARPDDARLPMLASISDDKTVRFWQPTIGRMVRFVRLDAVPLDVGWLADGTHLVVTCDDGRTRMIDPNTAEVTHRLDSIDEWAYSLAIHPSKRAAVVGGRHGALRNLTIP